MMNLGLNTLCEGPDPIQQNNRNISQPSPPNASPISITPPGLLFKSIKLR